MVGNIPQCEEVWPEISNYVDGEVDARLRAAMEEHFQSCTQCASVLAGTLNVVRLYGDERMLEVPAGFSGRLQKRLAKDVAVTGKIWSSWSAWLVPAAAMALVAASLVVMNSSGHGRFVKSQHAPTVRDIPPEMVVVVSSGARLFHVPGCEFIHDKDSERTLTAKQAMQEGYVPCPRCLRQYLKTGMAHHSTEFAASGGADAGDQEDELLSSAER